MDYKPILIKNDLLESRESAASPNIKFIFEIFFRGADFAFGFFLRKKNPAFDSREN